MKAPKASRSECPLKIFSFADALCVAVLSFINASIILTVMFLVTASQGIDIQFLYGVCVFSFAVSVIMLSIGVMIERKNDIKAWHVANDKESNDTNII